MNNAAENDGRVLAGGTPQRGRPRDPETQQAILNATFDLLEESGFAALTMEAVAMRAGVGKPTIYRRWPDKAALATDAVLAGCALCLAFEDTGDVQEDIRQQLRLVANFLSGKRGAALVTLLGSGADCPVIAAAFRERWLQPQRREARGVLERGIARRQVRPDADLDAALDALHAPLYFARLAGHHDLDIRFTDALVALVFRGLTPCPEAALALS
ncbi:MAG: TetR/AcrR family transcriptional regulator [Cytophagales bacterium]|nr:TetR/AcrR family transcriptional regulator [Armatimonadota bacterium]